MWTRIQLRIRLADLVGGLFAMVVRFMEGRGFVLGARVVRGDGELDAFGIWHECPRVG